MFLRCMNSEVLFYETVNFMVKKCIFQKFSKIKYVVGVEYICKCFINQRVFMRMAATKKIHKFFMHGSFSCFSLLCIYLCHLILNVSEN